MHAYPVSFEGLMAFESGRGGIRKHNCRVFRVYGKTSVILIISIHMITVNTDRC